jgi:negative regulator of sigma E activity
MTSTPFHSDAHRDERENLSALFDGELDADAARFALKRLGHDVQWRDTCGRWQLCGDLLRRQSGAGVAPGFADPGFADRVAAAIAADAALQNVRDTATAQDASITPRRAAGSRRGWIGGAALAASVAVAALFVARPFSDDAGGNADPAQVAAQTTTVTPAQNAQPTQQPAPQPIPAEPAQAVAAVADTEPSLTSADASGLAAGAVAVAEIPRRLAERRSRGQSQRAALRASERQAEAPVQVAAAGGGSSPVLADATHANPFRPQPQNESPAARPWPRAALPNYQTAGSGYTASYGNSPSFYPFEPATQAEEARTRPSVQERPQPSP